MAESNVVKSTSFNGRTKNRRNRHRLQLGIFLAVVVLVTLILLYMFTSISYVGKVTINKTQLITESKVKQIINLSPKDRIYSLPVSKMEQNLKMQDGVKKVEIHRHFPNKLSVDITEYAIVGVVADGSGFNPLLENGQVLKSINNIDSSTAPVVSDFGRKERQQLVTILNKTNPAIVNAISEINFVPNQEASRRVQLFMNDGLEVIGDLRTLGDKLDYYPGMAKNVPRDQNGNLVKPGIIDLEVGAVFIPYESQKAETRRLEMESEVAARKKREDQKLEQSINELKKQLDAIRTKSKKASS
ncbi:FtsQ-type POTRA domain-containing protein [Macrococcus equipercicus]|uniref:Cell division protein DivIB n=1 Tax=Macrococcus equipercicus TaxID=69967 RepID=A0ABQ6RC00_9STAP|nr:FtsQ-type POTRA domain-containing protein [Macrococcus equipercicus]KAA1042711.1 FtsQ-type POTRA domain-containing protein [Macrococcus equipercicus]